MNPKTHRPLTVAALLCAVFMSAIEATVVATAMPTVVADLGGVELYGWVGTAYLLAATVTVPMFGKLADRVGRKPILLLGIVTFLVGSTGCGFARSIELLIVARAVQGAGAGAMQPVSLTIVGDLFDLEERGKVQGLFGAVWAISGIAGPLVGGLLVRLVSWRAVFLINLPLGILSMGILILALREKRRSASTRIDVEGALAMTVGAVFLLTGAGGNLLLLGVGALCLVAFVLIERRAVDPMLPPAVMGKRSIAIATGSLALLGASMMGCLQYVPLYVQGVLGGSPTDAGGAVAPMLVGWPIAATLSGRWMVHVGFRTPIWVGSSLALLGLGALTLIVGPSASIRAIQASMLVYGFGMGFTNTALLIATQSSVGWEERGVATATNIFARSMGGALGVGALGQILAARLGPDLSGERVRALLRGESTGADGARLVAALGGALTPIFFVAAALALVNLAVVASWPKSVSIVAREERA